MENWKSLLGKEKPFATPQFSNHCPTPNSGIQNFAPNSAYINIIWLFIYSDLYTEASSKRKSEIPSIHPPITNIKKFPYGMTRSRNHPMQGSAGGF